MKEETVTSKEDMIETSVRKLAGQIIKDKELLEHIVGKGCAKVAENIRKLIRFNSILDAESATKTELERQKKEGKKDLYLAQYTAYMRSSGKQEHEIYTPRMASININIEQILKRWPIIKAKKAFVGSTLIYEGRRYSVVDILKDCKLILQSETGTRITFGDIARLESIDQQTTVISEKLMP